MLPAAGETVIGITASWQPGGKGLNQALAAARFGADVALISAVGADQAGTALLDSLASDGVEISGCRRISGESTGTAIVTVDDAGTNTIVVIRGAGAGLVTLSADDQAKIRSAAVLLCQLEVPLAVVESAAVLARAAGVLVIVNASPSQPMSQELLTATDLLVVNDGEAKLLPDDLEPAVIITRGAEGADYIPGTRGASGLPTEDLHVPAIRVSAVDTTGAGDTFAGTLAATLAERRPMSQAMQIASAAAALAVQRHGTSAAIPRRADTELSHRANYPTAADRQEHRPFVG